MHMGAFGIDESKLFAFHNHLYRNLSIIMFMLYMLNLQIKRMESTKVLNYI